MHANANSLGTDYNQKIAATAATNDYDFQPMSHHYIYTCMRDYQVGLETLARLGQSQGWLVSAFTFGLVWLDALRPSQQL